MVKPLHAGLLVAYRDAETAFEFQDQFEHIDRVESKPFAEQRCRIADLINGQRKAQAADERYQSTVGGTAAPLGALSRSTRPV